MRALAEFFGKESSVGILLIIVTLLAMLIANSPLAEFYDLLIDMPVQIRVGALDIHKPLLLWINDGLMAVFFFLVGMEIKREVLDGALKEHSTIVLPVVAAIGGMVVPALVFWLFNNGDAVSMRGWAIPMATDIAFALGILSLLGNRISPAIKIFLLTLAIVDDLGAIIVIALFYTESLTWIALSIAGLMFIVLIAMNHYKAKNIVWYLIVGIVLWVALLKSGVHATLAGVILGLFLPYKLNSVRFKEIEHALHRPVNFFVLPAFAFVNAGIDFSLLQLRDFIDPLTLGIALGLFVGKQIGIFLFSFVVIKLRLGTLPKGSNFMELYGVSILSGIGFTMSLFIGSLAFESSSSEMFSLVDERLGVILGSLISGVVGFLVLYFSQNQNKPVS